MTLYQDRYRVETARLASWDYTSAGWYFVTICTHKCQPFFGIVSGGQMHLSPIGEIAHAYWLAIPQHTAGHVALDAFVVMPDHVHGIIVIANDDAPIASNHGHNVETLQCNVSTTLPPPPSPSLLPTTTTTARSPHALGNVMAQISPTAGSLSAIVRSYKSAVSYWCKRNGYADFKWQARFYDHVIRDGDALRRIRQYISDNPMRWEEKQK